MLYRTLLNLPTIPCFMIVRFYFYLFSVCHHFFQRCLFILYLIPFFLLFPIGPFYSCVLELTPQPACWALGKQIRDMTSEVLQDRKDLSVTTLSYSCLLSAETFEMFKTAPYERSIWGKKELFHLSATRLRLTLYPWLMPLINCWGGGLQVNRMVVELMATTSTSCGGAVGTKDT